LTKVLENFPEVIFRIPDHWRLCSCASWKKNKRKVAGSEGKRKKRKAGKEPKGKAWMEGKG